MDIHQALHDSLAASPLLQAQAEALLAQLLSALREGPAEVSAQLNRGLDRFAVEFQQQLGSLEKAL